MYSIRPRPAQPLTGTETLGNSGVTASDFWRWAFSDLRENVTRGVLAEFLVARALGDQRPIRAAWDDYDIETPSGIKVEVKSAGYLQSWPQKRLSRITLGGLTGRRWDTELGYGGDREVRADVFVFAIQTCQDPDSYDMVDLAQWQFWVAPASVISDAGVRSVGLSFLRKHAAGPLAWLQLGEAVTKAVPT